MSTGHILNKLVGIVLILISAVGCSSQPGPTDASPNLSQSASSTVPDTLLADAMRRHNQDLPQVLLAVAKAAEMAPGRTDIAWLHSQVCGQVSGCNVEAAEAHLRRLDPANAAAWLGALSRARQQKDIAAENEVLETMSRGQRFDIYWNSLISRITLAANALPAAITTPAPADPLTADMNEVIGWVSAIAVPRFSPLGDSCSSDAKPPTAKRCRLIAKALMQGDSFIATAMGLGIAERLTPAGTPEATAIAGQIARSRYQLETAGQIIASHTEQDKISREMIQLMSTQRREQDVYLAVIRWAGRPLEPQ